MQVKEKSIKDLKERESSVNRKGFERKEKFVESSQEKKSMVEYFSQNFSNSRERLSINKFSKKIKALGNSSFFRRNNRLVPKNESRKQINLDNGKLEKKFFKSKKQKKILTFPEKKADNSKAKEKPEKANLEKQRKAKSKQKTMQIREIKIEKPKKKSTQRKLHSKRNWPGNSSKSVRTHFKKMHAKACSSMRSIGRFSSRRRPEDRFLCLKPRPHSRIKINWLERKKTKKALKAKESKFMSEPRTSTDALRKSKTKSKYFNETEREKQRGISLNTQRKSQRKPENGIYFDLSGSTLNPLANVNRSSESNKLDMESVIGNSKLLFFFENNDLSFKNHNKELSDPDTMEMLAQKTRKENKLDTRFQAQGVPGLQKTMRASFQGRRNGMHFSKNYFKKMHGFPKFK